MDRNRNYIQQDEAIERLREEIANSSARISKALTTAMEIARRSPSHPLSKPIFSAYDEFQTQQKLMQQYEKLAFPEAHEIREDQLCVMQTKNPEDEDEGFVKMLVSAVDIECSSVVKIFRDKKKDMLVVRFASKILVHEFLRRFRERNLFKMLNGARLTRDMNAEELEVYWKSVQQVNHFNRTCRSDRSYYVDLVTLKVCQKIIVQTLSPGKSSSTVFPCDPSSYELRPDVSIENPKCEAHYLETNGDISSLSEADAEAKKFKEGVVDVDTSKRIKFDSIPKSSETFMSMLLHFKEKRLWMSDLKTAFYNANVVCHVDALVRMAITPTKSLDYTWKMYVTKLDGVIFLRDADPLVGVDFKEKNSECCFKDAMTESRNGRSGLNRRLISSNTIVMPSCPLTVLLFGDEDSVCQTYRPDDPDCNPSFVMMKTRPANEEFEERFQRNLAPEWYLRALFTGVNKIIVGLQNSDDKITSTKTLKREELLSDVWSPSLCIHFLNDVLLRIQTALEDSLDLKTFTVTVERRTVERSRRLRKAPDERQIRIEKDEGKRFLPPPFVGAVLQKKNERSGCSSYS